MSEPRATLALIETIYQLGGGMEIPKTRREPVNQGYLAVKEVEESDADTREMAMLFKPTTHQDLDQLIDLLDHTPRQVLAFDSRKIPRGPMILSSHSQ